MYYSKKAAIFLTALSLLVFPASIAPLQAQGQALAKVSNEKGRISGKIVDKTTGEPLIGATIQLVGSSVGASADLDGKFSFAVPEGTHAVQCSFIGYETLQLGSVTVKAGQTKILNLQLGESEATTTNEVVIEATIKRESAKMLELELRQADAVASGLPSEIIRKSPDRTVADALKRVSGATITDNKFAVVRGLNDRYNMLMINGMPMASTEVDRKAFSLDLIPSPMVENLVITKTATPDLPGDFAGGFIQVKTKDIPYENSAYFNIGFGGHSLTTFKPFNFEPNRSSTDWIGFDNGARKIPDGALSTSEALANAPRQRGRENNFGLWADQTRLFNHDYKPVTEQSARPNMNIETGVSRRFNIGKAEFGVLAALNYSNSLTAFRSLTQEIRSTDQMDKDSLVFNNFNVNTQAGGLLNLSAKLSPFSKISFKNFYNLSSLSQSIERTGLRRDQSNNLFFNYEDFIYLFSSRALMSNQLAGEHLISPEKYKVKIDYSIGHSGVQSEIPDFRRAMRTRSVDLNEGENINEKPFALELAQPSYQDFTPVWAGRFSSRLVETGRTATINASIPFQFLGIENNFKVGGMFWDRRRNFESRAFTYKTSNTAEAFRVSTFGIDSLFRPENFAANRMYHSETTRPQDNYEANSKLNAVYGMMETKISPALRAIYGVRNEGYFQSIRTAEGAKRISNDTTIIDWLPSGNVVWQPHEKISLRGAYSQTVSRPEFRELARFAFFDVNLNMLVLGSEQLRRAIVHNYDFKVEYYPTEGTAISVNPFHKYFMSPIEPYTFATPSGRKQVQFGNANAAASTGVEVELRSDFSFIDEALGTTNWKNLAVFGNYTYIQSQLVPFVENRDAFVARPLVGQSPYVWNTGIKYSLEERNLDFLLTINEVGRRIAFADLSNPNGHIWENPRTVLDFSVSKKFFKHLNTRITVSDLLAQPLRFYQDVNESGKYDGGDYLIFEYQMGWRLGFSVGYSF